jgi:hypothetical protein
MSRVYRVLLQNIERRTSGEEMSTAADGRALYGAHGSSLRDLPRLRRSRRRRSSSWDRTGGNRDYVTLEPRARATLLETTGAGCVTHVWITVGPPEDLPTGSCEEREMLRRLVLLMHWDGEEQPSVRVPLGDFFGVGHGRTVNFASLPLQMSPQEGRALNCFFAMPFAQGARISVLSEMDSQNATLYYYVDYEELDELDPELARFHACWSRENPTGGVAQGSQSNEDYLYYEGSNLDGAGNYVILHAQGAGHYVGCVLNVENLRETDDSNWYGEGDDMIFIDGEQFPPTLHGTGTEDYFNTAWAPAEAYCAPYHGITLPGGTNWSGQSSMYRFHIEDPVTFSREIRVTIEHGHANKRSDDLSSTAYWYQSEPHIPIDLLPVGLRLPRA